MLRTPSALRLCLVLAFVVPLGFAACSGGSSGSGGSLRQAGEIIDAATLQSAAIPALYAMQEALATSALNFTSVVASSTLCSGVNLLPQGNTATISYPTTGCTPATGAQYAGTTTSTYSSASSTVTVTFDLTAESTGDSPQDVSGAVVLTLTTVTGTAPSITATGQVDGTITHANQTLTRTLEFDLDDVVFDNAAQTVTLSGDVDIDDDLFGSWEVELDDVVFHLDTHCIEDGTIEADQLGVKIELEFDSCNGGDVLVGGVKVGTFSW